MIDDIEKSLLAPDSEEYEKDAKPAMKSHREPPIMQADGDDPTSKPVGKCTLCGTDLKEGIEGHQSMCAKCQVIALESLQSRVCYLEE